MRGKYLCRSQYANREFIQTLSIGAMKAALFGSRFDIEILQEIGTAIALEVGATGPKNMGDSGRECAESVSPMHRAQKRKEGRGGHTG